MGWEAQSHESPHTKLQLARPCLAQGCHLASELAETPERVTDVPPPCQQQLGFCGCEWLQRVLTWRTSAVPRLHVTLPGLEKLHRDVGCPTSAQSSGAAKDQAWTRNAVSEAPCSLQLCSSACIHSSSHFRRKQQSQGLPTGQGGGCYCSPSFPCKGGVLTMEKSGVSC